MKTLLSIVVALGVTGAVLAEQNLIPNGDFSATDPLKGWRIDFPHQGQYVENVKYCQVTTQLGRKCIEISCPPAVIANQGAKVETILVPVTGGASYRAEVDCLGWDYSVKVFAEAFVTDPRPDGKQGQSIFVIPGSNGVPAKVQCWRAQFTDPPTAGKKWLTATREFTLPPTVKVGGKECKPEWLSLKVVVWATTAITGKSYFTNFRLYRTK